MINWKFWKRQPRIPIETLTELIDLRRKVAEYANLYAQLETKHNLFVELWLLWLQTEMSPDGVNEEAEATEDKKIADNMKAYWANLNAGSVDWRG